MTPQMTLFRLANLPLVKAGDDVARVIADALQPNGLTLADGDIVVIAQKIVSKAEGRAVALNAVTPSPRALEVARVVDKDPRLVELILGESTHIVRQKAGVLIVAHRLGFVMANAGIDQSNVSDRDTALLLPEDPDASARGIRAALAASTGADTAVIINDSFGRAWRVGTTGHAIGVAGINPIRNYIGSPDLFGRAMQVTEAAVADELAAAASFLMGQGDEGTPVIIIRGAGVPAATGSAHELVRSPSMDLFR